MICIRFCEKKNIKNVGLHESANRAIYYEVALNYDRTFDKHNVAGMFLFNRRDYVDLRNTDLLALYHIDVRA